MKVVIDTNCLVASIPQKGDAFWLYLAFRANLFTWVLSTEILNEYYEVLSDFYSETTAYNQKNPEHQPFLVQQPYQLQDSLIIDTYDRAKLSAYYRRLIMYQAQRKASAQQKTESPL